MIFLHRLTRIHTNVFIWHRKLVFFCYFRHKLTHMLVKIYLYINQARWFDLSFSSLYPIRVCFLEGDVFKLAKKFQYVCSLNMLRNSLLA